MTMPESEKKLHYMRMPWSIGAGPMTMLCGETSGTCPDDAVVGDRLKVSCERCVEVMEKEFKELLSWIMVHHEKQVSGVIMSLSCLFSEMQKNYYDLSDPEVAFREVALTVRKHHEFRERLKEAVDKVEESARAMESEAGNAADDIRREAGVIRDIAEEM
jgi:hypothetical protein